MLAMAGVLGGSALGGAGCSTFKRSEVARAAVGAEIEREAWPLRDRALAEAAVAGSEWGGIGGRRGPRVEYSGVVGNGVLRVFEPRNPSAFAGAGGAIAPPEMGRVMRFVSFSQNPDRPVDERDERFEAYLKSELDRLGDDADERERVNAAIRLSREGIRMRLSAPTVTIGEAGPKGLIVYFPGLGSSEYEVPLVREMQSRGWAVLFVSTPRVWWYKPMRFEIASQAGVSDAAKRIAAAVDDQLAEPAYALEAGLSYVKQNRPMLAGKPVVVMGFSAGALFAPAAVARVKDQVDAVVLMGAGGNLLEISQTSDLTNGGVELDWKGGGVPGSWRNELYQRYLSESRLDPVHMVRAFADKPMLLGLAEFDSTVPAKNGRMMAAAMVGADRLNFAMGHRLMFWKLANRAKDVGDWVEKSVGVRVAVDVAKTP